MPNKNLIFFVLILILGLILLTGCSNLKKTPPVKQFFDLRVDHNLQTAVINEKSSDDTGDALLVKELTIAPAFDSHAFVYRMAPSEYQTDFYNEFVTYPTQLITDKLAESLFLTIHFSQPSTHFKQDIEYRLSGKITHLYADFQNLNLPRAVMGIRLTLEKKKGRDFVLYFSHDYLFKEAISSSRPEQIVSGWNTDLNKIIAAFVDDFESR